MFSIPSRERTTFSWIRRKWPTAAAPFSSFTEGNAGRLRRPAAHRFRKGRTQADVCISRRAWARPPPGFPGGSRSGGAGRALRLQDEKEPDERRVDVSPLVDGRGPGGLLLPHLEGEPRADAFPAHDGR